MKRVLLLAAALLVAKVHGQEISGLDSFRLGMEYSHALKLCNEPLHSEGGSADDSFIIHCASVALGKAFDFTIEMMSFTNSSHLKYIEAVDHESNQDAYEEPLRLLRLKYGSDECGGPHQTSEQCFIEARGRRVHALLVGKILFLEYWASATEVAAWEKEPPVLQADKVAKRAKSASKL